MANLEMANKIVKVPGVFKSLESILLFLEKYKEVKEVSEVISIFDREVKQNFDQSKKLHPLIVYEGLDGSGKSLLTRLTAKKIGGIKSSTPPESIKHLRPYFDHNDTNKELRKAFYSLGNYIAAHEFKKLLQTSPVVVDRYWHSTAATAIAEHGEGQYASDLFTWPSDLLKPDLAVFLTVSEDVRLERMSRRKNFTAEENQLKHNVEYRNRLTELFRSMESPSLNFICCNGNPKKTVHNVLLLLEKKT